MINNILRGFIYFVVLVLVQVLILNNIHFLRVATPFLYLYFILKMPVGSSRTNVVFFSFLIGLTIDVFSNTPGMHAFACTLAGPHVSNVLSFEDPVAPLTVGTVDEFIEYFMARHSEARVDYVHDEPAVRALTRQGGVAFLLPPFEKSDLFKGIVMGGVLPRKTFSMGHAEEKRYYIECRRIKE